MLDVEVCDFIKVNVFQADSNLRENGKCELLGKMCFAKIFHFANDNPRGTLGVFDN